MGTSLYYENYEYSFTPNGIADNSRSRSSTSLEIIVEIPMVSESEMFFLRLCRFVWTLISVFPVARAMSL